MPLIDVPQTVPQSCGTIIHAAFWKSFIFKDLQRFWGGYVVPHQPPQVISISRTIEMVVRLLYFWSVQIAAKGFYRIEGCFLVGNLVSCV